MAEARIETQVMFIDGGGTPRIWGVVKVLEFGNLKELKDQLNSLSMALTSVGLPPYLPQATPAAPTAGRSNRDGRQGEANSDSPRPCCPDHKDPMIPSKQQRDQRHTYFYCPKSEEGVYCNHRAKVQLDTGDIKYWEAKR